ncbi:MAG: hypothetical protein AAF487_03885 [Bacteroidota bacterium]
MNHNYAVFQNFNDMASANVLIEQLKESNIDFRIVDNSGDLDITFAGNKTHEGLQVLVASEQFDQANALLQSLAEEQIKNVEEDHYLFSFSDSELYEILLKQDEWSAFDLKLAQQILKKRGKNVDNDLIDSLKKQRIEDLEKKQEGNKGYIIAGYIMALIGGFAGLLLVATSAMIGLYLWQFRKTLPDGRKVYVHNHKARNHGLNILVLSLVTFGISYYIMARSAGIWFFDI